MNISRTYSFDMRPQFPMQSPRELTVRVKALPSELETMLSLPRLPHRKILKLTVEKVFIEQAFEASEAALKVSGDMLNLQRAHSKLEALNAEMLRSHGRLNMRGVLDYLEDWLKEHVTRDYANRRDMFTKLFECPQNVMLVSNICRSTRLTPEDLPDSFVRMYGKLSGAIHDRRTPEDHRRDGTKVHIVKGTIDLDDCRALEEICKFFIFPYQVEMK